LFKRKRILNPPLIILGLIICAACILVDLALRNAFYNIAEVRAVQLATDAITGAIQQEVKKEGFRYRDFIYIHKDDQGRITMIEANTVKVNEVIAVTTASIQKSLEDLRWQPFDIPFGEVLGVPMLANYGPRIRYNILPVGAVRVDINDKFETAGINQTRHKIYLSFNTNVRIAVPSRSGKADVAIKMPLAESVIVGTVPSTFVALPNGIFGSVPAP
jgi:sporulation protein YunB